MIELFDTHAHFEGTAAEIAAQVARAKAAGVTRIMAVGGSESLNQTAALFPIRALGWDREQVGQPPPEIDYTGVAAVGEIGLDYQEGAPELRAAQRDLFAQQLSRAQELGKPAVIHTREADDDTLAILREIPAKAIIHCFTGSVAFCRQLLDLGCLISISGIVTFRKAENVREAARFVPDDRLLIETDCPFLTPVPLRGKPNEPAFLVHTARFLADLRQTSLEAFAALTTRNAERTLCTAS